MIILGETPGGGGLAMQDAVNSMDDLVANPEVELGAELQHYLKNRSYQKAWTYLQNNLGE